MPEKNCYQQTMSDWPEAADPTVKGMLQIFPAAFQNAWCHVTGGPKLS